ncbi:glycosyltransferase [Paenarthrobacter nicotinovorans]|uniref:glycosyltransferase n=1 Tax=Paenarthrobacter nicotinovorans TaxID=29320 RepID=UPI0011A97826|nr:glycosyltransferase [Paenarthrobacter nicotinovorans]
MESRLANLSDLLNAIRKADALIIHGYYLLWVPFFAVAGRLLGSEVHLMPHGALTARQQKFSVAKKRAFDSLFGRVTRLALTGFVTGSEIESHELRKKFPKSQVRVAGVGVPIPPKHKKGDLPHPTLRMLSMSRIAGKKRIDLSIDALYELRRSGVDAVLTVAGAGTDELVEKLKDHAKSFDIEDKVKFVGQLSGAVKERTFLESDIFLLPSEDENFGIGFAEAASYGLPCVVSTNVAAAVGMPESAGRLIDDPAGASLASAIRECIEPSFYQDAQDHARLYAQANFSWEAAADLWLRAMGRGDLAGKPGIHIE